jgi:5-methylcytosine-specific restriction endonuclease McrA
MKTKPANDKSYRKAADEIFMAPWRGGRCEVCGTTYRTVFHHIVPTSRSRSLRYDPRNGIILCQKHHTMGNDKSAHSTNSMAVDRFMIWFKTTFPDRYQWVKENERIQRKYSYRQALENLRAGRDAWE